MPEIDIVKYLNIPFKHLGIDWSGCDCLGLSKLFYEHELNEGFPDFYYEQEWEKTGSNYMVEKIEKYFEKTPKYERFCLITFKKLGGKIACHMGVMLDEINFLHIPRNKMPVVDKITNQIWKRRFHAFYKLKENV